MRVRVETDLPACARTLREVHHVDGYPDSWPGESYDWLLPDDPAWVAESGGKIVGHVSVVERDGMCWVSRLFSHPDARGSGVGESLLRTVCEEFDGLMLDVIEHSVAAIALYERLGWTLVVQRPAGWTMRDGTRPRERVYRAPK